MSEFITGPKMIALNAEVHSQREAGLQARIRELESEVELLRAANEAAVTIGLEQRDNLWERIAKAKAILTGPGQMAYDETEYAMILNRILGALDSKQ